MHITFTSLPGHLSYLDLSYPKEFGSAAGLQKRESTVNAEGGQIRLKEVWFEGACLLSTDFKMNAPCRMKLQCDSFCWLMSFVLSGEISTSFGPEREKIQMKKKEYQMLYSDALVAELLVAKPSTAFTICLTRRFVRKLLGKDLLPDRFEGGGDENLTLLTMNEPTGSRLGILVKEMMQAGQPDYIRRIFLESKILEMLSLQLERIENKQAAVTSFSQADIDKLHEARDIVEANIQTPCSLIELARKTGLNDFKLKKGFKSLFNQTVFGYLAQVRMDRAYLLLQQGSTVNEVSEAVGYKNPHHFSAAFKKRFDLLPRQIGRE